MINEERKTPKEVAQEMLEKAGRVVAIEITQNAIDEKRKEKVSALMTIVWVEQIEFLREVLQILKNDY